MRFFTADTHFSFDDIMVVQRDFRPFETIQAMNEGIIKVWNKQVKKGDLIYHIGDFVNYNFRDCTHYMDCFAFVKKIKADIILICGNNEERIIESVYHHDFEKFRADLIALGFKDVVRDGLYTDIGGKKVYMTHYPINHKRGMENLFGHIHTSCFVKKFGFNVGIDNHYLGLFSEDDIIDLFSRRPLFDDNVYKN